MYLLIHYYTNDGGGGGVDIDYYDTYEQAKADAMKGDVITKVIETVGE